MTYLWFLQYWSACTAALIPRGTCHLLGLHQPFPTHCVVAPVLYNSLVVRGLLPEGYTQGKASGGCNSILPCCRGMLWEECLHISVFSYFIFSAPQ